MTPPNNTRELISSFDVEISKEQAERFFKAVDWRIPSRPLLPPTISTMFRNGEFLGLQKFGTPLHKVLHGEQKYRFVKDLALDQKYTAKTFITSRYEKSGGNGVMKFFVFQTDLIDQNDDTCVECITTIIARG